ncbi:MAG: cupin domain-containing protein [Blastocatellia bacterium]|nr:cupin domain-containing protein [Blastocatellia bacterium]
MSQPVPAPDGIQPDAEPCFFASATENFRWEGVSVTEYKPTPGQEAGFCGILRQTLFGGRNESIGFEVRYFEIGPGGWSSLEYHGHAHAVIGLRGTGQVLLGDQVRTLGFLDLAYIGSNQPHRLTNEGTEPFGFLCIVDARRDTSRLLRPADLPHLLAQAETAHILKKGEF